MSDFIGFNKLRQGKIHMFCPSCRRKQSNAPRDESQDPPTAVLMHSRCDKSQCSGGMKSDGVVYFNARGRELDWETGKEYQ